MSLESFSRLKEYDSLSRERNRLRETIKDQEARITSLNSREESSLAQLSNLKDDYVRLQQELQDLEARLKLLNQQRDRWIDQGGEEGKRKAMETEISVLEEKGFSLLEELEKNEIERKDARTFLDGLARTMEEIKAEVDEENVRHREAISNIDLRLSGLLDLLSPEFKDALERTLKKNPAHGPFTRIENGSCFFCRYKISRIDESEIDMQKRLKHCPQCGRIFIPYGT